MKIDLKKTRLYRKPATFRKRLSMRQFLLFAFIAGLVLLVGAIIIPPNYLSCSGSCEGGSPESALCQLGMAEAAYHQHFGSYADLSQLVAWDAQLQEPNSFSFDYGLMAAQWSNPGRTLDVHCYCNPTWLRSERRYTSHYYFVVGQRSRDSFYILALPTPNSSQQARYYIDECQSLYSDDENESSPLPGKDYRGIAPPGFVLADFGASQTSRSPC